MQRKGPMAIAVANAGVNIDALLLRAQEEDFDRMLATNVKGTLFLAKASVRSMMKARGGRTRLNTNGHGDLLSKRPIARELVGKIDVVSVSLNAQDRETFERHCPSAFSPDGFTPMLEFIRSARDAGLSVVCTIVDGLAGVEVEACRRLAEQELRVTFRGRVLDEVG